MTDLPVVITTIHPGAPAIARFAAIPGVRVILVGDRTTPPMTPGPSILTLDLETQRAMDLELVRVLPERHYGRKNLGYLVAAAMRAPAIAETDDDNLPYPGWDFPGGTDPREWRAPERVVSPVRTANAYRLFTDAPVWPRGLPLDAVRAEAPTRAPADPPMPVGIWQGLADLDPDVDAIYRLTVGAEVRFEPRGPVALPPGVWCPFNSQNTAWRRDLLPAMYLPTTVSMRFCDILRGLIAQRCAWARGEHLGFCRASVYQERNSHDLMRDFAEEVSMHLGVRPAMDALERLPDADAATMTRAAYEALASAAVVGREEIPRVEAWLADARRALTQPETIAWTRLAS